MPAISIRAALRDKFPNAVATFEVSLSGFVLRQGLELEFVETDGTDEEKVRPDRVLGKAKGKAASFDAKQPAHFSFIPDEPPPAPPKADPAKPVVAFRFAKPLAFDDKSPAPDAQPVYVLEITGDKQDVDEGDWWEFLVRVKADVDDTPKTLTSQKVPIARIRRQLGGNDATYDWHDGHALDDLHLFHDGSTDDKGRGGGFSEIMSAIDQAQKFVLVVDWSFQPLFCPTRTAPATMDGSIGAKLIEKAAADDKFLVAIHTWAHTDLGAPDKENDHGKTVLEHIAAGLNKKLPPNLFWRATSREGIGYSHHQKFVVVDVEGSKGRRDLRVFWGGLDLTKGRFDWPAHPASAKVPSTEVFGQTWSTTDKKWTTDDWYNAEFGEDKHTDKQVRLPRQPWHDIHATVKGPAAWDFVREFVGRWSRCPSIGGNDGDTGEGPTWAVWRWYADLNDPDKYVQQHEGREHGMVLQVYRSQTHPHWAPPKKLPPLERGRPDYVDDFIWTLPSTTEQSIQRAYLQAISQAERFIYIENQYLIGSGSHWGTPSVANTVPETIVKRIIDRAKDGKPFHAYVIVPMFPEGDPGSGPIQEVRRNGWQTMQYMATAVAAGIPSDKKWTSYLSFHFLAKWLPVDKKDWKTSGSREERVRAHQRYMVYVHSKFMIVDDRYFILGSANLNERSQAGNRDSEIACGVWPGPGQEADGIDIIRTFRKSIWQEHFGQSPDDQDNPESANCVASVRSLANDNYAAFREMRAPIGQICRWPMTVKDGVFNLDRKVATDSPDAPQLLPDAPKSSDAWDWMCTGSWLIRKLSDAAE
jgi:phospholipase D1/2